jgi:hypothetical protein
MSVSAKREGRAAWRVLMFGAAVLFVGLVAVALWAWFVEGVSVGVFIQGAFERMGT